MSRTPADDPSAERRAAYRRGRTAEAYAAWLLRLKGYRIVARGYRCPVGEVDIIARRGGLLVAVEVKLRPSLAEAAEAVAPRQRQRIVRAMDHFMAHNPTVARCDLRFDAVLLAPRRRPRHIADAWRPDTA